MGGITNNRGKLYELVAQAEPDGAHEMGAGGMPSPGGSGTTNHHLGGSASLTGKSRRIYIIFALAFTTALTLCLGLGLATKTGSFFGLHANDATDGEARDQEEGRCPCQPSSTSTVPQYFQTSPQLWAGPTATGRAPFLAQTRTLEGTYVPNAPLQTDVPVVGTAGKKSIFEIMG